MTAQTLQTLFAHICGQNRCFLIDGMSLPICQRCLGLYAAVAITGACLLITGTWRQGLPPRGIIWLHAGMLLAAMLGGLHVIDTGPTWRLICGLWTGHVVITWLLTGIASLGGRTIPKGLPLRISTSPLNQLWRWVNYAAPMLYILAAIAFIQIQPPGWWLWTTLTCAGAIITIAAVLISGAMMVTGLFR
jgi:hypothetical protein